MLLNTNHDNDNNNGERRYPYFITDFHEILVINWPERNPSSHNCCRLTSTKARYEFRMVAVCQNKEMVYS